MTTKERIPKKLKAAIAAVLIASGVGSYYYDQDVKQMEGKEYIQAVADDPGTSTAIKVAMVMGSFYESSFRHIGTPYVDKLGKGQPITVCNGITDSVAKIDPNRYYTESDCYQLERLVYVKNEEYLKSDLKSWNKLTDFQQAVAIDFLHNKGIGNWSTSTYRKLTIQGKYVEACRQNERWNKGTVNGISRVLPGLEIRAKSNSDLCVSGDAMFLEPESTSETE